MPHVRALDLPYLAMDTPQFAADPFQHFESARATHPWLAKFSFGFVLTQYRAARDLMLMEDRMRTSYEEMVEMIGGRDSRWGQFQRSHISASTGPQHKRLRDVLLPALTPKQANLYRPLIRKVVSELLDVWAPNGAFDFDEFASQFMHTVMCRLIGAPPDAIPDLRACVASLSLSVSMDARHLPCLETATIELDQFARQLIVGREKSGPEEGRPDVLGVLLEARKNGSINTIEIVDMIVFLIISGFGTSKSVLTWAMHELVQRPEIYAQCAEDLGVCSRVIDETMRFHSTTTSTRILAEEIIYRDVRLPADTMLWFPWSVLGRDPTVAEDAHQFRPNREIKVPHLGFGLGSHMCIGQFIARAQLTEGLHLIAKRIVQPKSSGPQGYRPFLGMWSIQGLPIEFQSCSDLTVLSHNSTQ